MGVDAWTLWVSPPSCVAQEPGPTAHAVAGCCNVSAPCFECLKAACRIHPVSFPSSRPLVCCVCHPLNYLLSVRLTFPNNAPMNAAAPPVCAGSLGYWVTYWFPGCALYLLLPLSGEGLLPGLGLKAILGRTGDRSCRARSRGVHRLGH